jgi:hypothetical protein
VNNTHTARDRAELGASNREKISPIKSNGQKSGQKQSFWRIRIVPYILFSYADPDLGRKKLLTRDQKKRYMPLAPPPKKNQSVETGDFLFFPRFWAPESTFMTQPFDPESPAIERLTKIFDNNVNII